MIQESQIPRSKLTGHQTCGVAYCGVFDTRGIRNANFHLLRHTYATVCIESGFDAKTVSELLGHSNVNITLNRYVHSSMETKRRCVDRLNLVA